MKDLAWRTACYLRFDDFTAAQAGSADTHAFGRGAHLGMNRAQVDVPAPLSHVVGVTDVVSKLRPLAADLAYLCHEPLQMSSEFNVQSIDFTGASAGSTNQ